MGIDVCRYDYSQPQCSKDVCDRILCPMKSRIRRFCDEGHDIFTAADMKRALSERPVIGTIACVCAVDETTKTLEVKKMVGFKRLHNFQFEEKGIRVWRSYGKGPGEEFPFDQLVSQSQESTALLFISFSFDFKDTRVYRCQKPLSESSDDYRDNQLYLCECWEPGCVKRFPIFSELESHLNVGDHIIKQARKDSKTLYDKLRRNWVERFITAVNITEDMPSTSSHDPRPSDPAVCMGWALAKPSAGPSKFTDKVKKYLTAKFNFGEQTGRKADPLQVSNDMRKAKMRKTIGCLLEKNGCPKARCKVSFLASQQQKGRQQGSAEIELDQGDLLQEDEQNLVAKIAEELRPQHPLSYDAVNLCFCAKEDQLSQFNVQC
ncbi:unnamed protein product [Porites lobata]|uniref:C2H2-type domain-containing protein n=1 Tax=Porites lobata TaxID=104759 RepID=A0ABN8RL35_9CNID|nr:unnamed protein product [Porites lobata]